MDQTTDMTPVQLQLGKKYSEEDLKTRDFFSNEEVERNLAEIRTMYVELVQLTGPLAKKHGKDHPHVQEAINTIAELRATSEYFEQLLEYRKKRSNSEYT